MKYAWLGSSSYAWLCQLTIGDPDPLAYAVFWLLGFGGGELKSRPANPGGVNPPNNCTTGVDVTKPPLRPILVAIVEREGLGQEVLHLSLDSHDHRFAVDHLQAKWQRTGNRAEQ